MTIGEILRLKMKLIGIGIVFIHVAFAESDFFRFVKDKIRAGNFSERFRDKCLTNLIEEAYSRLGKTYIFISDDHLHEELLRELRLNFVHSDFTEQKYAHSSDSTSFYNLSIFRKKIKLKEVIKANRPPQNTKIFLLVKNYQEALEKFRVLWRYRLVHAVASFMDGGNVYYYTYFPYCKNHCSRVGKPHLLARCDNHTGTFSHKENLFPDKVKNLHGCPVDVTLKESIPSSYLSTSTNELTGWEVDLVNELLERINGVPKYEIIHSRKVYTRRDGYLRLVKHSEIGGGSAVTLTSLSKTDFCIYGMSLCALWIVPDWKGNAYSFNFLIKVFPTEVWALLFLTYLVMALIIRLFLKAKFKDAAFKLLPFLLGTTTKVKKMSRTVGALWLWFCLIMNAVYQSGYQSSLLVPLTPPKHIRTSDVMKSDWKILGVADVLVDLLLYFKRRYNVSERFINGKTLSYEEWIYRMTIKKDSAYFGFKETVHYHIDKTELTREIHIPETCEIKYLLTLVLKKNSHLTDTLALLANRLNENGFLDFYVRKHLSKESHWNYPSKLTAILKPKHGYGTLPPPINMDKMLIVFMCLLMGVSLAFIAFMVEIIYKGCCLKTTRKKPRQQRRTYNLKY